MRFYSLILSALALMALSLPACAAVEIGKTAPDFTATDTKGVDVTLSALQGKNVILEWNNPECPFVVKHYSSKNMQQLQTLAKDNGYVWITINSSAPGRQGNMTAAEANKLLGEKGASPAHIILDPSGEIGKMYDAKTTPHMFVINSAGNVAYAGAIDSKSSADPADIATAENYIVAAMDAIAAGNAPEPAQTKPYGCSVKYAN